MKEPKLYAKKSVAEEKVRLRDSYSQRFSFCLQFSVHGEWSDWSDWGDCQEHSPGEGTKEIRSRECHSKWSLDHSGLDCPDPSTDTEKRDCHQKVTRYSSPPGYQLQANHIVAFLSDYGPEYDILLKFRVNSMDPGGATWYQVFGVVKDANDVGDRYPTMFIRDDGHFRIKSNGIDGKDIPNVQLNQDYMLNIRQKKTGDNVNFQIFMNDQEMFSQQCSSSECSETLETGKLYLAGTNRADIRLSYFVLEKKFATCFAADSGLTLSKDQMATVFSDYGPEYEIVMKLKINSFPSAEEQARNVFHIGSTIINEDRFPALFLFANGKFGFRSLGMSKYNVDTELDRFHHLNIRQRKIGSEIYYQIFINGERIHQDKVEATESLVTKSAAILYTSNNFWEPADVTIEYFYVDKRLGK